MKKLSLILQEILKVLLWFLFFYVWLRYFTKKFIISLIFSILLAVGIYLLTAFINRKKHNKAGLKLKEKTEAENMFLSLALQDKPIDFFAKLAEKKHENITKHKNYITIYYPKEKVKTLLYFEPSFDGLTISKTMEIYQKVKKESASKIVICCKSVVDSKLSVFLSNFNEKFLILDEYESYQKLYKLYDYYPKITQKIATQKTSFKDFINYSFNKKRTKGYLLSALLLIISSLFVPMTIYYCIIASLLVIFAIFSQFNPYFNNNSSAEIL